MWSDEEWAIVQACQSIPHVRVWSNHALRFEPALCEECRKLINNLKDEVTNAT